LSETPPLNEELVERVDQLGSTPISMRMYRHTSRNRDPLSGGGARISGGRWNPRGVPTIYLAQPHSTAVAELRHLAEVTGVSYESLVHAGRMIHTVEVKELRVLDLRDAVRLADVGLSADDLLDDDWSPCAAVGHAAWFLHFGGVLAQSARDKSGAVLAAFEDRVESELVCVESTPIE
jgi:RES domain-containing protein